MVDTILDAYAISFKMGRPAGYDASAASHCSACLALTAGPQSRLSQKPAYGGDEPLAFVQSAEGERHVADVAIGRGQVSVVGLSAAAAAWAAGPDPYRPCGA